MSVCFETCIAVTRNVEWEVTFACSTLQAPSMVRINPKAQLTLQRLLATAATEENKYTKEILSLKVITSLLISYCTDKLTYMFQNILLNCFRTYPDIKFKKNFEGGRGRSFKSGTTNIDLTLQKRTKKQRKNS